MIDFLALCFVKRFFVISVLDMVPLFLGAPVAGPVDFGVLVHCWPLRRTSDAFLFSSSFGFYWLHIVSRVNGFLGTVDFTIVLHLSALHHKGAGGIILGWLMVSLFLFWRSDRLSFLRRAPLAKQSGYDLLRCFATPPHRLSAPAVDFSTAHSHALITHDPFPFDRIRLSP